MEILNLLATEMKRREWKEKGGEKRRGEGKGEMARQGKGLGKVKKKRTLN